MDHRESTGRTPSHAAQNRRSIDSNVPNIASEDTGSHLASNDDLLSGTGSIPLAASSTGTMSRLAQPSDAADSPARPTQAPPRYVRKRTPHRSQGTLDDINDENEPSPTYTHDSNISVGGATPLSGMAYRRARSNMSRVGSSRYGQYLEIPKGRRTIFASRERARRRRSVLALLAVVALLVIAAMILWTMLQNVLK